jgi:flagellar biosynthesis protein FlhF
MDRMKEAKEKGVASMRIKSYFAGSVEQAIQQARQELGAEAMLVTSRRSSQQNRRLGTYEVVFALQPENATTQETDAEAPGLSAELQILRSQLDEIKRTIQLGNGRSANGSPEIEQIVRELTAADLDDNLARRITAQLSTSSTVDALRAAVNESLAARISIAPDFDQTSGNRVLVFAGPAGAGKTTTLTKIAIQKCLASRTSVRIISVDPHRVASHEKLRTFAGIIGTGFTAANTIRELLDAVDEYQSKNVLLIDTPGYGNRDLEAAHELSDGLKRLARKEIHLVLPASMKRDALMQSIRQYGEFQPDCLLITKLDETESYGGVISAAIEAGKPLSFFSHGQTIPEDLEPANTQTLLDTLFRQERAQAVSAA